MTSVQAGHSAVSRSFALGVAVLLGGYLLLTSTLTLHDTLWKYDVKRILELCLLPLIFAMMLFNRTLRAAFAQQVGLIPGWVATVLLALLGLGILSSFYNATSTMALFYSLAEVALLSLLLVAALAVAASRRTAGIVFDQVTIVLIAMVGIAVGLQELLGVFAAWSNGVAFHPRIALLHFSWPRFYNDIQSWSIPVITALPLVFPGKPLAKFFCVAALALEWYVVIATGGRATMVGVAGAILVVVFFLPEIRKTLIQYQLAGLAAAMLIYALVVMGHHQLVTEEFVDPAAMQQSAPSATSPDQSEDRAAAIQAMGESTGSFTEPLTGQRVWSSSGRIDMWLGTLHDASTHPLLGIGPMNYACQGPIYRAGHPHNFPLQFMVEWGIPAVLLLLFTAGLLFFKLARTLRTPGDEHAPGAPPVTSLASFFAAGTLAALLSACLSGVLVMPEGQVTGVLVCGCLLGFLPGRSAKSTPNLAGPIAMTLALMVSFTLLVFARQEIAVAELRWEQTPPMDRGIPRMWQNGKVCRLYQQDHFEEIQASERESEG